MREKMMDVVCESIETDRCIAYCNYPHCGYVQRIVDNLIHNNIVEVVRCKDCIHWDRDFLWCDRKWGRTAEDDFCSYGERRTDDE